MRARTQVLAAKVIMFCKSIFDCGNAILVFVLLLLEKAFGFFLNEDVLGKWYTTNCARYLKGTTIGRFNPTILFAHLHL